MIIIGDVHGCYKTLQTLLAQITLNHNEQICFVGDLIDRGPKSKEVVDFVKDHGYLCVKGNHEDMAVKSLNNEFCALANCSYEDIWANNGGVKTALSFKNLDTMKEDYYNWLRTLPIFMIFKNIKINKNPLIVSHSFVFSANLDNDWNIMWNRDFYINEEIWTEHPKYFNVFGHTPVKNPVFKDCYSLIDTGCVFNYHKNENNNLGNLTAIRVLDGMRDIDIEVFTQKNCED